MDETLKKVENDDDIINNKENEKEDQSENSEKTEELNLEEKNGDKNNKDGNNKNSKNNKKKKKKKKKKKIEVIEEETEEDKIIKQTMGFNKFCSTKNKSHKDTDVSAVFLGRKAKRIYQRFMNYKPFSKILKQTYMSLNQEF